MRLAKLLYDVINFEHAVDLETSLVIDWISISVHVGRLPIVHGFPYALLVHPTKVMDFSWFQSLLSSPLYE